MIIRYNIEHNEKNIGILSTFICIPGTLDPWPHPLYVLWLLL
jgi:hypothetical protein